MTSRDPDGIDAHASARLRTGESPIERQALARARLDVASMPASDVVQLALWPDTIANWARSAAVSTAVAYNMLARVKPYRRVRELLAYRLDVPTYALEHLIDAGRPLPHALRPPDPDRPAHAAPAPRAAAEDSAAVLLPGLRDGSNPIERRAVFRVETELPALPASLVVQLALYPETLAAWARREELPASLVYSTLSGTQPNQRIRYALARRLGVTPRELDALVGAARPEPRATRAPLADLPAPDTVPSAAPPTARRVQTGGATPKDTAAESPLAAHSDDPPDQLSLGV